MAAVTGTILDVSSAFTPSGAQSSSDAAPQAVEYAILDLTFAGTYASAGNSTTAATGAGIAASRRDGRTYTILSACCVAFGDLNGTKIGAKNATVSADVLTMELTTGDGSTEWADGLMSTAWNAGIKVAVFYKAA